MDTTGNLGTTSSGDPVALDVGGRFERALIGMDRVEARRVFDLRDPARHPEVLDDLIVPTLERIGSAWEDGRLSLAQVYMGARICEELVDGLPTPAVPRRPTPARIGMAVLEDSHALGKRIVIAVLHAAGFEVLDLGAQLPPDALAERAIEGRLDVLMVSTLMLRAALQIEPLVLRLQAARAGVKVVVGGAPFRMDRGLWQVVGADAMGATATDALRLAARFSSVDLLGDRP